MNMTNQLNELTDKMCALIQALDKEGANEAQMYNITKGMMETIESAAVFFEIIGEDGDALMHPGMMQDFAIDEALSERNAR